MKKRYFCLATFCMLSVSSSAFAQPPQGTCTVVGSITGSYSINGGADTFSALVYGTFRKYNGDKANGEVIGNPRLKVKRYSSNGELVHTSIYEPAWGGFFFRSGYGDATKGGGGAISLMFINAHGFSVLRQFKLFGSASSQEAGNASANLGDGVLAPEYLNITHI